MGGVTDASEANLNADKRILKRQPFLHRVYYVALQEGTRLH